MPCTFSSLSRFLQDCALVYFQHPADHLIHGPMLQRKGFRILPQLFTVLILLQQEIQELRRCQRIAYRGNQAGLAVRNHLGQAPAEETTEGRPAICASMTENG